MMVGGWDARHLAPALSLAFLPFPASGLIQTTKLALGGIGRPGNETARARGRQLLRASGIRPPGIFRSLRSVAIPSRATVVVCLLAVAALFALTRPIHEAARNRLAAA